GRWGAASAPGASAAHGRAPLGKSDSGNHQRYWRRNALYERSRLALAKPALFVPRRSARHDPAVASRRISGLLALEISWSARKAQSWPRAARTHPTDEQGEPIVGRPAHPW